MKIRKISDTAKSITSAQEILTEHWDGILPIDPTKIAKKMNIDVRPVQAQTYSGRAYKDDQHNVIEYNSDEYSLRQRFTIAHELGHHALNHTESGHQFRDDANKFNVNITIPEETEANKFAAELLIPEAAVKHLIFKKDISSLEKLAELFGVSTVAMKYRLMNLKLI